MASEEVKKKWGTIFMGDREASVEQLNAMQEPLRREKQQREQADDYMERVRARAADRAREILGAAYAERQKVLEEAAADAASRKKAAMNECARLRAEGETARRVAQTELEKAEAIRADAEKLRAAAHDEGYRRGMEEAGAELHEFRADMGLALGELLRAIERQRKAILDVWRDDLVALTQCAAQAGAGYVLSESHEKILRNLVFQALDLLESRKAISLRVNPADEAAVSDMFRAARERFPELGQWIVTGDEKVEKGGLVAESGSGSVDLRRENFREMVNGVLAHLSLPEGESETDYANSVRELVEKEVGRIASLTPEPDRISPVSQPEDAGAQDAQIADGMAEEKSVDDESYRPPVEIAETPAPELEAESTDDGEADAQPVMADAGIVAPETGGNEPLENVPAQNAPQTPSHQPSIEELEAELFPLEEEMEQPVATEKMSSGKNDADPVADPESLAGGGFV